MTKIKINNQNIQNGLVVVSAKEHGKLYLLKNGELTFLEYVEEHPPTYSDNEAFFTRAGSGEAYTSGAAKEIDNEKNLEEYIKAIVTELSDAVKELNPECIYVFEPQHYKGQIEARLTNPTHIPVRVVRYGNFVTSNMTEIAAMLEMVGHEDELDPNDPASVEGKENAEEKRKILEVGKMLRGQ